MSEPTREAPSTGPGAPCKWCGDPIPATTEKGRRTKSNAETCSKRCRQANWRFHVEPTPQRADEPMRFAYADPPYPGRAELYDECEEVDHAELVARLVAEYPDGWALSTSIEALREVWALCPPDTRLCGWFKAPRRVRSSKPISTFEAVLVHGGRPLDTSRSQAQLDAELLEQARAAIASLRAGDVDPSLLEQTATVLQLLVGACDVAGGDALVYQGRYIAFPGALIGMKPPQFSAWMFGLLGAQRGDQLDDLYPGSGAVTAAWLRYTAGETLGAGTEPADPSRRSSARRNEAMTIFDLEDAAA